MSKNNQRHRRNVQIRLFDAFDWHCLYCNRGLVYYNYLGVLSKAWQVDGASVDHIITRRDDGPNNIHNYVAACVECNNKRQHTDIYVFIEHITGNDITKIMEIAFRWLSALMRKDKPIK